MSCVLTSSFRVTHRSVRTSSTQVGVLLNDAMSAPCHDMSKINRAVCAFRVNGAAGRMGGGGGALVTSYTTTATFESRM